MDEVTRKRLERMQEELDRVGVVLQIPAAVQHRRDACAKLRLIIGEAEIDDITKSKISKLIDELDDV